MARRPNDLYENNSLNRNWRPIAAYVYLGICIFDFVIAPSYMSWHSNTQNLQTVITQVANLDPTVQETVLSRVQTPWNPITLMGGGTFHIAFGAILGAASWSRGQEKISAMRYGSNYDYDDNTNSQTVDPQPQPRYIQRRTNQSVSQPQQVDSPDKPDNPDAQ